MMTNFIVIAVVAVIVGLAVWYIRKEKRKGARCVGCPSGGNCSGSCAGCSSKCDQNQ